MEFDVAILGAGFSGSLVAVHLADCSRERQRADGPQTHSLALAATPGPRVALIDKSNTPGPGLAYGAASPRHLLNVPASRMSAFPDAPEHFLDWLRQRPALLAEFGVTGLTAGSFLPRQLYGRYLTALVQTAVTQSHRLQLLPAQAADIRQTAGAFQIQLDTGQTVNAGTVVLALGNFPSSPPVKSETGYLASPRYCASPWTPAAVEILTGPGDVLVLGTGLTTLDLLVTLQERKPTGQIHLLSRHGLFPQPHAPVTANPPTWDDLPANVRGLVRLVRAEIERGADWRGVIDSLRPVTQKIWRGLSLPERQRFLRHVRPYWEVARHRAAPAAFMARDELARAGRLVVHRGRVRQIVERADGLEAVFGTTRLFVSAIVNCTGPETDCRKIAAPLLVSLLRQGLIRADALGLGIEVTADGAVRSATGETVANLYAMGALRKGLLWETTAVPELRAQAATLAQDILQTWRGTSQPDPVPPTEQQAFEHVWVYEI